MVVLLNKGKSVRAIATELERNPSNIQL
ncbi:MAG: helix-turn-helix domain-containing protein [Endomicrobium sp.]|nr:helix-turn-helix domain-containing protein [Endomicrobium sp.]